MPVEPSRESGQSRATRRLTEADGARPIDRFAWERALRESDLPFGARGVLAILGGYMDRDGTGARPSLDTLAAACDLSRRQVSNHLRPALELGWIARDSGRGPGSATTYAARLPARRPVATPAESGQPVALTSGQPASRTASSAGSPLPESGQSATGERATGSRPPRPDHVKTTLSASQEANVIDPETIREERDQGSADDEHPKPFGPEHVQRIAVGNGAAASSWTPSRQDHVRHLLATKLGGPAINHARPLLVELASSAGTIAAPVDSYVAGILRSDDAARDVEKLARAGRKRMPKPVPPSPLDAMPAAVRADVLASAEAGLIDRGDVVPEWRDDAQREHFARIIDREARQLAARRNTHRPERVSA